MLHFKLYTIISLFSISVTAFSLFSVSKNTSKSYLVDGNVTSAVDNSDSEQLVTRHQVRVTANANISERPTTDGSREENRVLPIGLNYFHNNSMNQPESSFTDEEYERIEDIDWCSSETGCGNTHVMCHFPVAGPSNDCQNYSLLKMNDDIRTYITSMFNNRRNMVAGGFEYLLPSAAYMMKLKWDNTLEVLAQRWADQCLYDPYTFITDPNLMALNDFCRDHPNFRVAQVGTRMHSFVDVDIVDLTHLLINMISSANKNLTDTVLYSGYVPISDAGAIAFHPNAHFIGCGTSRFEVNPRNRTLPHRMAVIYCNIGPIEDLYLLDRYYKEGTPCSECPAGSSCPDRWSNFENLCSFEDDLDAKEPQTNTQAIDIHSSVFLLFLCLIVNSVTRTIPD